MGKRRMPGWLVALRENNPEAYRKACQKGGRKSGGRRTSHKQRRPSVLQMRQVELHAQLRREVAAMKEAACMQDAIETLAVEAAWQMVEERNDHVLPPEPELLEVFGFEQLIVPEPLTLQVTQTTKRPRQSRKRRHTPPGPLLLLAGTET